jgi:formylglycine-generating enzyme required for sulfatase activity
MAHPGLLIIAIAFIFGALAGCSRRETKKPWKNTLGMQFVRVPGTQVMFSVYETRVREFDPFREETKLDWIGAPVDQTPDHPIANVTWDDANAFCAWLTKRERMEHAIAPSQRYRLPTDAEWSLAAGLIDESETIPAEKNNGTDLRYVWGNAWPPPSGSGNFCGEEAEADHTAPRTYIEGYRDAFPRLAPVGQFNPNAHGLYDLAGNLLEFCDDWFDEKHRGRVARGGSWLSGDARTLSATHRAEIPPRAGLDVTGFRCVLETGK